VCAQNVDVVLHASAFDRGVELSVDIVVIRAEHWGDAACGD